MCLHFFHLLWPSSIFKRQASIIDEAKKHQHQQQQQLHNNNNNKKEAKSQEATSLLLIDKQKQQQQHGGSGGGGDGTNWLWCRKLWASFTKRTSSNENENENANKTDQHLEKSAALLLPVPVSLPENYTNSGRGDGGPQHYVSNILLDARNCATLGEKIEIPIMFSESSSSSSAAVAAASSQGQEQERQQQQTSDTTNQAQLIKMCNNNNNNNSDNDNEETQFRIKTANRRHLEFDEEFDLGDASAVRRSKWSGPFHFIQAADCQFGMIDSYVHKRTEPGWSEEIQLCEQLVDICNRQLPAPLFVIICGDLIDSLPASEIGRRQAIDFKRIFAKLNPTIPLVCVCGNHDVGDEPTSKTITDYRQTFGDDYFYFTKNDILFIVINSQFYQHREFVPDEAGEQDRWLEALLDRCRLFKYSIVFEHIPWFLETPDEENDYFNIRKDVRLKWLRKFKDAGVTKIMCGHYHRNAGGWFEDMELVVTTAIGAQCGQDKSGVRIVKVFDDTIEHKYYAMQDIPLNVELKKEAEQQQH